jgi:hypothetical protein
VSYQRETQSPDERGRRLRRSRLTLLVAVAIAAAVIVPLVLEVRQAAERSRASNPSSTAAEDGELLVDPEEPELGPLAAEATALAQSLDAREEILQLAATTQPPSCPEDTGAMSAVLGLRLDYEGGALADWDDQCRWSADSSEGPDHFSVGVGFLADWTAADVEDLAGAEGCWATPVESFGPFAVVEACLWDEQNSSWTLFVPDSRGAGVWTLGAIVGQDQPVGASAALEAVLDVADATW